MSPLETADRHDSELARTESVRLTEKIAALREQLKDFQALKIEGQAAPTSRQRLLFRRGGVGLCDARRHALCQRR